VRFAASAEPEARGVWFAWAGANVPTRAQIASTMDLLARSNLNVVYVDVWRFGYPYYRSAVFQQMTGLSSDPRLESGRDILAEMITEGHRNGLEIYAWFEAGFAATYSDGSVSNLDVYNAHPDWFARQQNGSQNFTADGGITYRWLTHTLPEAQQFLIALCTEVACNYDVDGIELDRVRYPELDCGYDDYTKALYRAEKGSDPPINIYDPGWKQWRGEQLVPFMAQLYDSIKAVNPHVIVSNAPLPYTWGYENFCQDWAPWINRGHLDIVSPQLYYTYLPSFLFDLDRQLAKVDDDAKIHPGIAIVANDQTITPGNLITEIETIRQRGLQGHVIWYHNTLPPFLDTLKATVYQETAAVPGRPATWRLPAIIVNETDADYIVKSEGWKVQSTIPGYSGANFYADTAGYKWLDYYADIAYAGWYELYIFSINQIYATTRAPYVVYQQGGSDTVYVNQRAKYAWHKLGDYYFPEGTRQKLVQLSNYQIDGRYVFADAIMLLNTNRPEKFLLSTKQKRAGTHSPQTFALRSNFPNPFNSRTCLSFELSREEYVELSVLNLRGQVIKSLIRQVMPSGQHRVLFNADGLASGIYLYRLQVGENILMRKMVLLR